MNRDEKIRKLANAIRDYRGRYHPETKKWICAPDRNALVRVEAWLQRLGLSFPDNLARIDGFKSFPEFNAWLAKL